jgi:hypothetical protein
LPKSWWTQCEEGLLKDLAMQDPYARIRIWLFVVEAVF